MKGLRKLQDGVNPVPKASDTLHFVKHSAIAEDKLVRFRIGTWKEKSNIVCYFIQGIQSVTGKMYDKNIWNSTA